jgi:hypothetical protein
MVQEIHFCDGNITKCLKQIVQGGQLLCSLGDVYL